MIGLLQENVQDPELHRSYSLKTVTRVLLNDDSYANLPIANGEAAHFAWVRMHELTDPQERSQVVENLKAYCCQDTLAQVHLQAKLVHHAFLVGIEEAIRDDDIVHQPQQRVTLVIG